MKPIKELIEIGIDQLRRLEEGHNLPDTFYTSGDDIYLYNTDAKEISFNEMKRILARTINEALTLTPTQIALYICRDDSLISFEAPIGEQYTEWDPTEYDSEMIGTVELFYMYD